MHRDIKIIGDLARAMVLPSFALFAAAAWADTAEPMTADQIKQAVIQESIASYPGHCPCPYNHASDGSMCGKRSAWSKAGGYAPICYPNEVTTDMMKQWSLSHGYLWNELKN